MSRAPIEKIERYKAKKGWTFPLVLVATAATSTTTSTSPSTSRWRPLEYNYRTQAEHEAAGTGYYFEGEQPIEEPGMSCFLRDGDEVFHTYSTFGRGAEMLGGSYYCLDLTALGRQEEWEEPKGRSDAGHAADPSFPS